MPELEYKINEYLSVKLEGNETVIYVAGKRFNQCKRLLIHIPVDEIGDYDEIESIDDVVDSHHWDVQEGQRNVEYDIPPEAEFLGHCSNLQAFYEHGYDTRLLHSNIAFPLLRRLTSAGDVKAQKVFREEIASRYESGNRNVREFLQEGGYLKYLDHDEVDSLRQAQFDQIRLSREGLEEVEDRIRLLELSIHLLEDHLMKLGNKIDPKPLLFIKNQIDTYKRELKIRKDYHV